MLSGFMGPDYRPTMRQGNWLSPPFVNRNAYKDKPGPKEWRLHQRYDDSQVYCYHFYNRAGLLLSNPFNMGEEWYDEAKKIIAGSEASGWPRGSERLKSTYVYRSMRAEELLEAWWIEMAGL
jgi:hypothetical protein